VGELVERAKVDARRGGPCSSRSSERSRRSCAAEWRRARACAPFEQSAAFSPGRFDHYLGFALCRCDGVRRVAFGLREPG